MHTHNHGIAHGWGSILGMKSMKVSCILLKHPKGNLIQYFSAAAFDFSPLHKGGGGVFHWWLKNATQLYEYTVYPPLLSDTEKCIWRRTQHGGGKERLARIQFDFNV